MSSLDNQKCEACDLNASKVNDEELQILLSEIPGWHIKSFDNIMQLERTYTFANFIQAMDFSNKVAHIAETEDHHPSILIEWGKVKINWWTHKIKGLHKNDFIMAAKTEVIYETETKTDSN